MSSQLYLFENPCGVGSWCITRERARRPDQEAFSVEPDPWLVCTAVCTATGALVVPGVLRSRSHCGSRVVSGPLGARLRFCPSRLPSGSATLLRLGRPLSSGQVRLMQRAYAQCKRSANFASFSARRGGCALPQCAGPSAEASSRASSCVALGGSRGFPTVSMLDAGSGNLWGERKRVVTMVAHEQKKVRVPQSSVRGAAQPFSGWLASGVTRGCWRP